MGSKGMINSAVSGTRNAVGNVFKGLGKVARNFTPKFSKSRKQRGGKKGRKTRKSRK
jgi:hypothetical protein